MISNLSNSFRVLSMCNVAVKSSFTTAYKLQLRDIHLHQPMFKSIEEKIGLPAKPKRPTTAYFRFMNEVRSSVQAKNPKLKLTEVVSLMSKMWKSLDANRKEKFAQGLKEEKAAYATKMAQYKSNLSEEDVLRLKEARFGLKKRRAALVQKKRIQELGKPKKPASSYLRFFHAQKDRRPKETYQEFVKRVSAKWNALSDVEKAKYGPAAGEEDQYRKDLAQWENKMRKLGHFDVVSSESSAPKPKPRVRKSSAE